MNICFLVNLLGFGGLEIQTILRAKDALQRGHKALIFVKKKSRAEEFCKKMNFPYTYLSNIIFPQPCELSKYFEKERFEVCIVPKTKLLPIAVMSKIFSANKPKIIFYQQMQSGIIKKDFYHNWIYQNIDGAIVLTEIMKKMLIETTNVDPKKVFVVPYGVEWETFQFEKKKKNENRIFFQIPEDKYVVGCIGRIEPLKGQATLIEAFAKANIPNSLLVIAGSIDDPRYFKMLIDITDKYKISDKVLFQKFTFDVPKLLSTFDLFVMPSLSETFGLVLVEAMASSLPVIATNSGGVPEIVENLKDGLLFEPKNSSELSKLIQNVFNNKDLATFFGSNALSKVQIKFDYKKNVNYFFEVVELICGLS